MTKSKAAQIRLTGLERRVSDLEDSLSWLLVLKYDTLSGKSEKVYWEWKPKDLTRYGHKLGRKKR